MPGTRLFAKKNRITIASPNFTSDLKNSLLVIIGCFLMFFELILVLYLSLQNLRVLQDLYYSCTIFKDFQSRKIIDQILSTSQDFQDMVVDWGKEKTM